MKVINKILKTILYILTLLWVFLGLYLFALLITASVCGLVMSGFSLITKTIPLPLQEYGGLITVITAIPVTLILYLTSFLKARKQSKAIIAKLQKEKETK